MSFVLLSDRYKAYIVMFGTIAFIILLVAIIASVLDKNKIRAGGLSLFIPICIVYVACLMELNQYGRYYGDFDLFAGSKFVNDVPPYLHLTFSFAVILFSVYSIYSSYKNYKSKINIFSVKEALENLPTGILFMRKDKGLLLSNHIMHSLSKELMGRDLQTGEIFWEEINALQNTEICVINSKEPAFILNDGRVWQFSRTACEFLEQEYYQIKATDITALYRLSDNTRKLNEKLSEQQIRLKRLTDIIEKNSKEEVAVNMKINFHDNFGNLLALTKKTLRESPDLDTVSEIADYWENLSTIISDLSDENMAELSLTQINLFGDRLGCKVEVRGELPIDDRQKKATLLSINEMLKNAYRHAGAKKLLVDINHSDSQVIVTIQNEMKFANEKIEEGGGLSGLRQKIEEQGGLMDISCGKNIVMTIKFFKQFREGNYEESDGC